VNTEAGEALTRTVDLIAMDVFGAPPGGNAGLNEAIVEALISTRVRLRADARNLSSYAGQTNLVALFALVAMMGIGVELDVPEVRLIGSQPPLRGDELRSALVEYGNDLIPGAYVGIEAAPADLTFVLGDTPGLVDTSVRRVSGDAWRCSVQLDGGYGAWQGTWPFGALAAAGAAAPEALRAAVARMCPVEEIHARYRIQPARAVMRDLTAAGVTGDTVGERQVIDVVSGGAITNSALYCLARVPSFVAVTRVIEPDSLVTSNLNRYALARRSDCGKPKTTVLMNAVGNDDMVITGVRRRFSESNSSMFSPLAPLVLLGVDDIPSRWAVQRSAPGWVSVGATSHFLGMVTTHGSADPCVGCAHPHDEEGPPQIPTISFVSFWAGLMQARALLLKVVTGRAEPAVNIWPLGLAGLRGIHYTGTAPRGDCPVSCKASRLA
jgi:ThiF family protein